MKKHLIIAAFLIAGCLAACRAEGLEPSDCLKFGEPPPFDMRLTVKSHRTFAITLPGGREITISLVTGEVTIPDGMKPSEASQHFWKAVTEAFPSVREKMLAEEKARQAKGTK